jgi:6-phosphogluconate dehydrogenase
MTACKQEPRRVVVAATQLGIPIPGFSSALSYYDALRTERLPAALTQGLRDFFGAHTYSRTDADPSQKFHTLWSADRTEVPRLAARECRARSREVSCHCPLVV